MKKITLFFLSAFLWFFSSTSSALELKPLHASLTPSGAGSEHVFRVTNGSDRAIPVVFKVTTRKQRPDGTEGQSPADASFMVFPPQAVIPANKTQKVRVQWLGEQNPNKELAYRLVVEQVPVKLSKEDKTGVQMVMTLIGSIYIEPEGVQHNIAVSNLQRSGNKLTFTVSNNGTKHALLSGLKINLSDGGQKIELSGQQVNGAEGKNILAGSYRHLSIPYPNGLAIDSNWQAQLKFY